MSGAIDSTEDEQKPASLPGSELRNSRMSTVGMPVEKSENFADTSRRLLRLMSGEKFLVVIIMLMAIVSVALVVSGPRILGHATDILFDGLTGRDGRDGVNFTSLHRTLEFAMAIYVLSFVLAYSQTFIKPLDACIEIIRV